MLNGGPPANIAITVQPTSALDKEVFDPASSRWSPSPMREATRVPNVLVTASIGSGTGTLQGRDTATTNASGVATFTDLGISGAGSQTLKFAADPASATSSPINIASLPSDATPASGTRR